MCHVIHHRSHLAELLAQRDLARVVEVRLDEPRDLLRVRDFEAELRTHTASERATLGGYFRVVYTGGATTLVRHAIADGRERSSTAPFELS